MKLTTSKNGGITTRIPPTCLGKLAGDRSSLLVSFLNTGGGRPALQQLALAKALAAGTIRDEALIARAAIALWNARAVDADLPRISKTVDALTEKLAIGKVSIHRNLDDPAGLRYGYSAEWDLDAEHGFGVLIQNGRVLEIGHADVAIVDGSDEAESPSTRREDLAMLVVQLNYWSKSRAFILALAAGQQPGAPSENIIMERLRFQPIAEHDRQIAQLTATIDKMKKSQRKSTARK